MSDVHLRILRAAARSRARQLKAHRAEPGETQRSSLARRAKIQRLATSAREQLSRARKRRSRATGDE